MSLKSKHRTADGETMLVAEMESDHLLNWIDYCIRAAEKVAVDFLRSLEEAKVERTHAQTGMETYTARRMAAGSRKTRPRHSPDCGGRAGK